MSASISQNMNLSTVERLHDGSRVFGPLHSAQPSEDCQIARIGERDVVLPADLDLSSFIGSRIGLVKIGEECRVRGLA